MPLKQSKIKIEGNTLSLIRADNRYINTGGDSMNGNLSMNSNRMTDLPVCTADNDAATKLHVDQKFVLLRASLDRSLLEASLRVDQTLEANRATKQCFEQSFELRVDTRMSKFQQNTE